jgi:hypothetical protein
MWRSCGALPLSAAELPEARRAREPVTRRTGCIKRKEDLGRAILYSGLERSDKKTR